jgi:hypothetical protein
VTRVATDAIAKHLDAYQLARDEGPVNESIEQGQPVTVSRLERESRWPELRAMATGFGVAGAAACGLTVRRHAGGIRRRRRR